MRRLRFTSPGVLVVLVGLSTVGIIVLDLCYLRPYVAQQRDADLRWRMAFLAGRLDETLRDAQRARRVLCRTWAAAPEWPLVLRHQTPDQTVRNQLASLAAGAADSSEIDLAWVTGPDGRVLANWTAADQDPPHDPTAPRLASVSRTVAEKTLEGSLRFDDRVVLFARCPLAAQGNVAPTPRGQLWVGQHVSARLIARLGRAIGAADARLVGPDQLPEAPNARTGDPFLFWPVEANVATVPAAWTVRDPAAAELGYLHGRIRNDDSHHAAVAARRIVLIVLCLSVALAPLLVAGVHVMVAVPVLRLGKRLQRIESQQARAGVSRGDLNNKPIDFVRRLEAAFDRLAELSKTDELTALGNRRHFNEVLDRFYEQARRYGRPLSVMAMDVDYFKAVNDTGGHGAGDEMLKVVARAIRDACRRADLPARLGGDEFAVLMPETSAHDAVTVAERIRQAVAANVTALKSVEVRVTVSLGVADLDSGPADCGQDLMTLADAAVYRAKELGRNQVVQAGGHGQDAWRQDADQPNVSALCSRLAGLDTEFQTIFLTAVQEIIRALERRDPHMADHARQVRRGGVMLARHMGLPSRTIRSIEIAATLHDIGMLTMPDAVLLCPHQLDEQQTRLMRRHPILGAKIMQGMQFLEREVPIVRCHHERYDGQGYPEGLSGPAIPLPARILTVADSFVAMVSPRTFRSAKSCQEALAELEAAAGSQFDPAVINAFLELADQIGEDLLRKIKTESQPLPHLGEDQTRPAAAVSTTC